MNLARRTSLAAAAVALLSLLGGCSGSSDPVACPGLAYGGAVVRVLDRPSQTPVSGAVVELTTSEGVEQAAEIEPGVYQRNLGAGRYAVRVEVPGYLESVAQVEVRQVAPAACGPALLGEVLVELDPEPGTATSLWVVDHEAGVLRCVGASEGTEPN